MRYLVIPARRGSKGLPFKNRKLFEFTAKNIPEYEKSNTIVSTDDEVIEEMAFKFGFQVHKRAPELSSDTTSTTDLLKQIAVDFKMDREDDIVMLYLTYPERSYKDIEEIYGFYKSKNGNTLLCKQEATSHPYLCYYNLEGNKGVKVVDHDLYRRQDYPSCFFSSHFVVIVQVHYLDLVDKNLCHPQTVFYPLSNKCIDVDTEQDLKSFLNS